jgi:hypothetical protein
MTDNLFPKRLTRRGILVSTGAAAEWTGNVSTTDLASRATIAIADADDNLAPQLGDGKETDSMTNRPDCQANPALFAAPHAFSTVYYS